jgi:hypothetical protein
VEYIPETDREAWVRYPPPRRIRAGTALRGIPTEVSRAVPRGWHANNGVVLGNPRLGFVRTGQTVDGQPGLEGDHKEWDHDLAPAVFDAWNQFWAGAALAHDRWIILDLTHRRDRGDPFWAWRIARRRGPAAGSPDPGPGIPWFD